MNPHTSWMYTGQPAQSAAEHRLGGKGAHLVALQSLGHPVPPFYVITTAAFEDLVLPAVREPLARLLDGNGELRSEEVASLRKIISALPLPQDFLNALDAVHKNMFSPEAFVAVRSSAVGEDAQEASFAGMHASFLFVKGAADIAAAVKKVWASLFEERALAYQRERQQSFAHLRMAVVVQQMVDAEASGVMFTADPTTGNTRTLMISSLFGAGEGLVSAGLDADTFTLNKTDLSLQTQIAEKQEQLVLAHPETGGLKRVPLPDSLKQQPSLNEDQVRRLARKGLEIESAWGRPQDIEFSLDQNGHLFILQARAITGVQEYGPAAGNRLIWDNSNIIESYSGVTTPMTFSFIKRAYTIVYHCFSEIMGIPQSVIQANQTLFENMLGLFRGQVYYNLLNWFRLVSFFPGFNYNRKFLESMMGLKESIQWEESSRPLGFGRRYFVELPALAGLILRVLGKFIRIRRLTSDFQAHFNRHFTAWSQLDLRTQKPHQIRKLYIDMERTLLWRWQAPIINDFFVMVFYGVLKKLCSTWCGDASGSLQNDLLCGEGDIESTQPIKRLMAMARMAYAHPGLKPFLLEKTPDEILAELPARPEFSAFQTAFQTYLRDYGFRCMNELKLEEPNLRDRPQFIFKVLKNYLESDRPDLLDIQAMEARERQVRITAEAQADQRLQKNSFAALRRTLFYWVLRNARLGVKNRENMRLARSKIYGLLRELLQQVGRAFAEEGILARPEDIFYLTLDEVWDYIQGQAVTVNLRGLVHVRQEEFQAYREEKDRFPDDHFETFGAAYHKNLFKHIRAAQATGTPGALQGIACCPGTVRKQVKVILDPTGDMQLNGEILVTERTDPGWVPLYPSVSGLLIARGSILSHSAIVAREMGIPTIVGIPGLLGMLQTGQWVEMDGSAGTVRVLPPEEIP